MRGRVTVEGSWAIRWSRARVLEGESRHSAVWMGALRIGVAGERDLEIEKSRLILLSSPAYSVNPIEHT